MKFRWMMLFPTLALMGCASCSHGSETCSSIMAIARDAQRMRYAKEWLVSRLSDDEFRKSIRLRNTFDYYDERFRRFGSLDWVYLGLPERHAELTLNMPITDSTEWDVTQVRSASLEWGRSSIVIKLGPAEDLGLHWTPEDLARMREVSKDIFVYCGNEP